MAAITGLLPDPKQKADARSNKPLAHTKKLVQYDLKKNEHVNRTVYTYLT